MSAAHRRRCRAGHLVLLALVAAAFTPSPARAADGQFTQILCVDPANDTRLIAAGTLPDGMTSPSDYAYMSSVSCSDNGISIGQSATTTVAHTGAALVYRAGTDVKFKSASLYRSWAGSDAWGLFVNRGVWDYMWTTPYDDRCSSNTFYRCSARGTTAAKFVAANKITLTAGTESTNGFNLSVLCDASGGGNETCRAASGKGLRLYGGTVTLEDTSDPEVSGTPSGDLYTDVVDGVPLVGTKQLSITGTDTGSGLYRIRILLDDETKLSQIVNSNGGRCADAIPTDTDDYQFVDRRPCRANAGGDYEFDTTQLADGQHNLKIQLEDASGNTVTVLNRTVTIDNIPAPSVSTVPALSGSPRQGSSLLATAATFDDHGAPGEVAVTREWQRCKADGTACSAITGITGLIYELTGADLNRVIRVVETARNSDGEVVATSAATPRVTRADGTLPDDNNGVDDDNDGVIDEPGETAPATGPSSGSSGVTNTPGANGRDGTSGVTTTAAANLGAVNGENASSRATLTAKFAKGGAKGRLAYGRTLTASGRLVDESGRPIRNAIIDIAETPSLKGAKAATGRPAVTNGNGEFTYRATGKAGSRSLSFLYRYQRQGAVVAHSTLALNVKAGVKLSVKLKGVTATYKGKVLAGSMPKGGKLVIVQGRAKGGSWQTFASRRAGKTGAFKGKYRLKVRRPGKKLQFRVRVLSESGWNYGGVTSRAVTRKVK